MKHLLLTIAMLYGQLSYCQNWTYKSNKDPITLIVGHTADTKSLKPLKFNFPYGINYMYMRLHYTGYQTNSVALFLNSGQINSTEKNRLPIRFYVKDSTYVRDYEYSFPTDGSSDYIFIENADNLIYRLKESKKIVCELEFYHNGTQTFEFNVSGLKWEYY